MPTLLTKQQIQQRITELAAQVSADFDELLAMTVLMGGIPISWDLLGQVTIPADKVEWDSVGIESYDGTKRGDLRLYKLTRLPIVGKKVLIFEDIIDSGETIKELRDLIWQYRPLSVSVCSLLVREGTPTPEYYGFILRPEAFVKGFGLDEDQTGRIAQDICY